MRIDQTGASQSAPQAPKQVEQKQLESTVKVAEKAAIFYNPVSGTHRCYEAQRNMEKFGNCICIVLLFYSQCFGSTILRSGSR